MTGILMAVVAVLRYRNTRERLETGDFRPAGPITVLLGFITALFGAILAAHLIYTSRVF